MKRKLSILCTFIVVVAVLAGCGSSKSASSEPMMATEAAEIGNYSDYYASDDAGFEAPMEMAKEYSEESALSDDPGATEELENGDASNTQDNSRKLIKTVNMTVETEEFDVFISSIEKKIEALGGYTESMNVSSSSYSYSSGRDANITARIPAVKLNDFVNGVTEQTNVINKSQTTEDVTLNYVDMQAKKASLETEYDRLNVLLEQADSLETIIALEERLAEVRYELESYESRLRVMDNQVTYSTVYLYVNEVVKYTPTPKVEKTFWQRLGNGFVDSCKSLGIGLQNFLVGLVSAIPFLVIIAVIVVIIIVIVKKCIKGSEKKKREAIAKRAAELNKKAKEESENKSDITVQE